MIASSLRPKSRHTPLVGITIEHSECPTFYAGQQFDTLGDFDAMVRLARTVDQCFSQVVILVLTWRDGTHFRGKYDLSPAGDSCLFEHVYRVCSVVLETSSSEVELRSAAAAREFVVTAALAETLNSIDWVD